MNLLSIKNLTKKEILFLIAKSADIKKSPKKYSELLSGKSMLMIFQKPSLRTRVSFEVAMTQLGGHAIYSDTGRMPLGEKESVSDTAKVASRYCDLIIARLFEHKDIIELGKYADVPVINALTNHSHPCQILADLLTITEKKKSLKIKVAYLGDSNNNITHSWIYAASIVGFDLSVACPPEHAPNPVVLSEAKELSKKTGSRIEVVHNAEAAVKNADVIYTDSWMSYHVPKEEMEERVKIFRPFQVTTSLIRKAKKGAVFMNCLPAMRGYEQTAEVIDGKQSIVFDQAENRLHMQKAIILYLMGKI